MFFRASKCFSFSFGVSIVTFGEIFFSFGVSIVTFGVFPHLYTTRADIAVESALGLCYGVGKFFTSILRQ